MFIRRDSDYMRLGKKYIGFSGYSAFYDQVEGVLVKILDPMCEGDKYLYGLLIDNWDVEYYKREDLIPIST